MPIIHLQFSVELQSLEKKNSMNTHYDPIFSSKMNLCLLDSYLSTLAWKENAGSVLFFFYFSCSNVKVEFVEQDRKTIFLVI